MNFDIIVVPNPILKDICSPVKKNNWRTKELIKSMKRHIWQSNALGIAAPQLGNSQRIIVCRYHINKNDDGIRTYINPTIVAHSETTCISVERCLSIPRVECNIERYIDINVEYLDENFDKQSCSVEELESFVIQHEIDHLDGILMIEKQLHDDYLERY